MDKKQNPAVPVVGYGKPPVESRFKKGMSGNPRGRKKGTRNFSTDVKEMLAMPVPLEQGGKARQISTQKASLLRLREMALRGDARALDRLLSLGREHADDASVQQEDLTEQDRAILNAFVARAGGRPNWADDPVLTESVDPEETSP